MVVTTTINWWVTIWRASHAQKLFSTVIENTNSIFYCLVQSTYVAFLTLILITTNYCSGTTFSVIDGRDLFQSSFSSGLFEFSSGSLSFQSESSQSACVDSKLFTSYVHLLSSKATWVQLLKLPAGSTLETMFPISLINECHTVIFGLPNGLFSI